MPVNILTEQCKIKIRIKKQTLSGSRSQVVDKPTKLRKEFTKKSSTELKFLT